MASFSASDKSELIGNILKNTAGSLKWKLNLPKKPNYDNVYLFKETKKFFKAPCCDLEIDKIPDSYKGEHCQERRRLQHTESRLKYANDSANKKRRDMARQWKELEAKEEELKANFIEFNSFLVSNANKRKRAEQNYKHRKAQIKERTEAIEFMNKNIEKMKKTAEAMDENAVKFDKYEKYLRQVVDHCKFRDIMSMINRYILLEETKNRDTGKMQRISEVFHEKQLVYMAKVQDFQVFYLQFVTELSELSNRYDEARRKTRGWERVMENIWNKYTKISEDINWVGMAIKHLFEVAHYRLDAGQKKKISMDKLAHINSSLKALDFIQEKLNKIRLQQDADTSMAQVEGLAFDRTEDAMDDFERTDYIDSLKSVEEPSSSQEINPDNAEGLWVKKVVKQTVPSPISDEPKNIEPEDLMKKSFPIKLSPSKFDLAQVKDFENLYRKALIGIQQDKLATLMRGFKSLESLKGTSFASGASSRSLKPRKTKWAVAAMANQLVDVDLTSGSEFESVPPPPTAVPSTNVLTLLEDGDDDYEQREVEWMNRRSIRKKKIEKKFDRIADPLYKELSDREKERAQQMLPPIYQGSQVTEDSSYQLYTKKQDAYIRTHKSTSRKKSLGLIGVQRARRLSQDSSELPYIFDKIRKKSLQI